MAVCEETALHYCRGPCAPDILLHATLLWIEYMQLNFLMGDMIQIGPAGACRQPHLRGKHCGSTLKTGAPSPRGCAAGKGAPAAARGRKEVWGGRERSPL